MSEVICCPGGNSLYTFVHGVSKIVSIGKNGRAFVLEMTNCMKILYLSSQARVKINVSVVVDTSYCSFEFSELTVNHLNRL